ncbi:hypothetical protein PATSB16_20640 [Pandoraea thiooxydans]|uniref:hypothetical protein n=1 Tax=Pandoraea thiooxydans TaxID=445709 RepID=UPI00094A268C|nr:hypothetical protein [Pandoraea thiooxydans]APR95404.1 hypothetical protein PATSB16_20640 [Pandoraea thiooxydans]
MTQSRKQEQQAAEDAQQEDELDEALRETFPASDPVAVDTGKGDAKEGERKGGDERR